MAGTGSWNLSWEEGRCDVAEVRSKVGCSVPAMHGTRESC